MRHAIVVICGLTLVAGGVAWWSRRPHTDPAPAVTTFASTTTDEQAAPAPPSASIAAAPTPVAGTRPRSLRGTRSDGDLELDPLGRFKPSLNARRLFDYQLTTSGEASLDTIRARIVAVIERRLPPAAAREAVDLLDRYLLYRERARQIAATDPGDDDAHARFATIWALRREILGAADADAFFAEEEAYDRVALERARIMTDPFLSSAERAQQLPAVEAAIPEPMREARDAATLPMRLDAAAAAMRAAGGTEADVDALRAEMVGTDAAARLAALDREEAEWRRRLDAFRDARTALERDATRSADDRAGAVQALLASSFTPAERLRVEAIDRLASSVAP